MTAGPFWRSCGSLLLMLGALSGVLACRPAWGDGTPVAGPGAQSDPPDRAMADEALTADELAQLLNLEAHVEGGYFRRTFQADHRPRINTAAGPRYSMTSIYYLLTADSPVGHFHQNRSDILHFFHVGDPIEYFLLDPAHGRLERVVVGGDLRAGQQPQLLVKGGVWKASRLLRGAYGYGLISEAVAPGFAYEDMTLARRDELLNAYPEHKTLIHALTRAENPVKPATQ